MCWDVTNSSHPQESAANKGRGQTLGWHSTIITKHFGMFITVQYCHSSISANNTATLSLPGILPKPDKCNI